MEAGLNDGGDESSELGFLPALLVGQLNVHKVETMEGMLLLDTAKEVHTALCTGVALDRRALIDDLQLVPVGSHLNLVPGDDTNDGKEGAGWLPALRAAARVVVRHIAPQGYLDGLTLAVTVELATGKRGVARRDAIVDGRVE